MRIGIALPQCGKLATPDSLIATAARAEELGFDSAWVSERLLWPTELSIPYPASADGKLPTLAQTQLDPLDCLTFVAAQTKRLALGTSVINFPQYQPLRLARRLATIDVLSGGRLRVGLGNGWMPEEYSALGLDRKRLGRRADEYIAALKSLWTENPVEIVGDFVNIPRSIVGLKPIQKPHPPIYMAAFAPSAMRRVAHHADGWNPAGLPVAAMVAMFGQIKQMAAEAGRDPDALELVVRANVRLTTQPMGEGRPLFAGCVDEIRADVQKVRDIGADELLFDVQFCPGAQRLPHFIEHVESMWELSRSA